VPQIALRRVILNQKTRILFVCLGNIVRSPLAENMFRYMADEADLGDRFVVDSAGTGGWHVGERPDSRMVRVAAQKGLNYSGTARQIKRSDFDDFDYLIAMDRDNRAMLLSMARGAAQQAKIRLLREFDPQSSPDAEVPDPYYGGIDGFETTYRIVERACRGLLDALKNGTI
jgi:protein-tyrosine phosphatase